MYFSLIIVVSLCTYSLLRLSCILFLLKIKFLNLIKMFYFMQYKILGFYHIFLQFATGIILKKVKISISYSE